MNFHPIRSHTPSEQVSAPRGAVILAAGVAAWLGLALLGHGFWLLIQFVGASS